MKKVTIVAEYSRRFPDPLNAHPSFERRSQVDHYILLCKAAIFPDGIPTKPNPRAQNISRRIYKDVAKSLTDETDPTFHLKNKGITIIAESVRSSDHKQTVEVFFDDYDGIVDGAHTYRILLDNRDECPEAQYVKVEIITGIPRESVQPIAGGLNTAVQVQDMSLLNLGEKFDWIKDTLRDESYATQIAYMENQEGEFDARDIVALLALFNIGLEDLRKGGTRHPKEAYTSKGACLNMFAERGASFKKLRPILKDILQLHDLVHLEGRDLYNERYKGRAAALAFYRARKRGKYKFLFSGRESKYRLHDGALMPILGAFRFLVTEDENGDFTWKTGSFDGVKELWRKVGGELINITKTTSDSRDRNANSIGKDENHWDNLYKTVALAYLQPGANAS